MSTYLTAEFISDVRNSERSITVNGRDLTIRHSTARNGKFSAELEVLEGTSILGYITPYERDEHGAVAAHLFGQVAPVTFRDLDGALLRILQEQPSR